MGSAWNAPDEPRPESQCPGRLTVAALRTLQGEAFSLTQLLIASIPCKLGFCKYAVLHLCSTLLALSFMQHERRISPFPKFCVCTPSIFSPLFSLRLIFCSRTTAAALLQSLALIHTSDPPDTLSALPQCTSAPKLSQTHLAFSLSLTSPSLFNPFSFIRSPRGSSSSSFIRSASFFLKLSKFPLSFHLFSRSLSDKSIS